MDRLIAYTYVSKTATTSAILSQFLEAPRPAAQDSPVSNSSRLLVVIFDLELDGISEAPAPQGGPMSISPEQLQEMLKQSGAQQQ